mgnify:CR=1 FL=1
MSGTHKCAKGCSYITIDPWLFLRHLQGCPHVAKWIGEWAKRIAQRPDWRKQVGLG